MFTTDNAREYGRRGGIVSGHRQRRQLGKLCEGRPDLAARALALLGQGYRPAVVLRVLRNDS